MNTSDDSMRERVRTVIEDPQLHRNPRGKVAALLRLVDINTQKMLCCLFAERLVPIYSDLIPGDSRLQDSITTLRNFLVSKATIEDVDEKRHALFEKLYELQHSLAPEKAVAHACIWTGILAIFACCQRELDVLCSPPAVQPQPTVGDVAAQACYCVARAVEGQKPSVSEQPALPSDARRAASNREAEWQLEKTLSYMGLDLF